MSQRSASGAAAAFYVLTLGSTAFYAGFRPWLFGTPIGAALLVLLVTAGPLFSLTLRAERVSWRGVFGIVGMTTVLLIGLVYIPSWYVFTYLPALRGPLLSAPALSGAFLP